jgi:uncharacterized membrane protein
MLTIGVALHICRIYNSCKIDLSNTVDVKKNRHLILAVLIMASFILTYVIVVYTICRNNFSSLSITTSIICIVVLFVLSIGLLILARILVKLLRKSHKYASSTSAKLITYNISTFISFFLINFLYGLTSGYENAITANRRHIF